MTTKYLTKAHIIAIHHELIERFGGLQGIRDESLLESAIGRYQSGYYADHIEEAAALMESLGGNHPFIDGNKRIAVTAPFVFLMSNEYAILLDDKAAFDFISDLFETHEFIFARLEPWIRQNIKLPTVNRSSEQLQNSEYPSMESFTHAIDKLSASISEMYFLLGQRASEMASMEDLQREGDLLALIEFGIKWMKTTAADISLSSDRILKHGDEFLKSWATIAQWAEDYIPHIQQRDKLNQLGHLSLETVSVLTVLRKNMSSSMDIIRSTSSTFEGLRKPVDTLPPSHQELGERILHALDYYEDSIDRCTHSYGSLDEQLAITIDSCHRLAELTALRSTELD